MIRNLFTIALRNLRRNRVFSTINIVGLAIGMASAILIGLWIQDELGFDRFHKKEDRLFMLYRQEGGPDKAYANFYTPKILAPTLQNSFPDVENVARLQNANFLFTVGDRHFNIPGNFTDSGFMQMFSFRVIEGNGENALAGPTDIVITQAMSKKLFGNESALNKQIRIDSVNLVTVKAVLQDLPDNTRFHFQYLLPWAYLKKLGWDDSYWANNSVQTFYTLKPGAGIKAFDTKIKDLMIVNTRHDKVPMTDILFSHPAAKWHLYSRFENGKVAGGQIEIVRIFILIAAFILLIACINFMNLSTARSEKRAREVGIRKVAGATKSFLIIQFLAESLLFCLMAAVLASIIVELSLPSFNLLVHKELFIPWYSMNFWLLSMGFVLLTGFLAGSYPAFYLSSFQASKVLKGIFNGSHNASTPRRFLVVLQFSFAIILIISTVIVIRQIRYAQDRDSGYDRANLVYSFMQGDLQKNYPLIHEELLRQQIVTDVTRTSQPMTQHWSDSWGFKWPGSTVADGKTDFNFFGSDDGFVKTLGLKIISGRDMNLQSYPTDSTGMLLNESAVKIMRLKDPIGATVRLDNASWHVVGVVKDFILESPYDPIAPMIIVGPKMTGFYVLNMKLNSARSVRNNLAMAESIFKKYNPSYPFEYNFLDQEYAEKFASEKRTGQLSGLFTGLTIFISCLGLFGLASYMAENRIKEIGIRKVLGASVFSIIRLLSSDFIKLIVIAFLIAAPIAWFTMTHWLGSFAYRVTINGWLFAATFLVSMAIALLTVSYQSIRTAMSNPSKNLRSE